MKLVFVGGGTLGPVTPLIAAKRAFSRKIEDCHYAWIGTPIGPERPFVEKEKIPFDALPVVKWTRYPSFSWFSLPWDWMRAKSLAHALLRKHKPDAVVTMGGYTAVPVVRAAAAMGIPCITHQLDLQPLLTNRLIARYCESVTTTFEYEKPPFGKQVKNERIATPVRFVPTDLPDRHTAAKTFGLDPTKPVTFLFGGGTGAQYINELVQQIRDRMGSFTQILHVTGMGKNSLIGVRKPASGYAVRPFLMEEMIHAYAVADLVISRAGMGAITELASLSKAMMLIPLPDSAQEANAAALEERGAAIVVSQRLPHVANQVVTDARLLLRGLDETTAMGERAHTFIPTDNGSEFAERILAVVMKRLSESMVYDDDEK